MKSKKSVGFLIIILSVLAFTGIAYGLTGINATPVITVAEGDPNVTGTDIKIPTQNVKGGYNILDNEQDEGVRVTLVDESNNIVSKSIDFANNPRKPIDAHFGNVSKLEYLNGQELSSQKVKPYVYKEPKTKLPKIVKGDIATIKRYFCDKGFIQPFSELIGMDYDEVISGKYKLMLEPVGYPKINGVITACTATEIALYDKKLGGAISKSMIMYFSHANLPYAMYLEKEEFGIPTYLGYTNSKQTNDKIIKYLGVGAISFTETPPKPPYVPPKYEYRTDTDVITPLEISGVSCILYGEDDERGFTNPVSVTYEIAGKTYPATNGSIVFPSSGISYVKWHTPKKPQELTIKATARYKEWEYDEINDRYYLATKEDEYDIKVNIVEIIEKTPPNPDADDKNPKFKYQEPKPIAKDNKQNSWEEYEVSLESETYENSKGDPVTKYKWIWTTHEYTAKLGTFSDIYPDPECKTDKAKSWGLYHDPSVKLNERMTFYTLKSGYGIRQEVKSNVLVERRTTVTHIDGEKEDYTEFVTGKAIPPQNAVSFFSDFGYKDYFRLLEVTDKKSNQSILQFKVNPYSTYGNRTHFTPIWYPDNQYYVVNSMIFDSWTPAGQLYLGATTTNGTSNSDRNNGNAIYILGNLWNDWYVQRLPTMGVDPEGTDTIITVPQDGKQYRR